MARGRRSAKFACEPAPAEHSTGRFANIRKTYRKHANELRLSTAIAHQQRAAEFDRLADMTDAELERHFEWAGTLAVARLAELKRGAR